MAMIRQIEKRLVLFLVATCGITGLIGIDLIRVPPPGWSQDSWEIFWYWALKWPPFWGQQHIIVPRRAAETCLTIFVWSCLALIVTLVWLTAVIAKRKLTARRPQAS